MTRPSFSDVPRPGPVRALTQGPEKPTPAPPAAESATAFAGRLRVRGVTFAVRNNRLWLLPPKAYKTLSDDERAFIRHHRAELKDLVYDGALYETTTPESAPAPEPESAPAPEPEPPRVPAPVPICIYCRRPCIGSEHPAYPTLHHTDPREVQRRSEEATAVMLKTMRSN